MRWIYTLLIVAMLSVVMGVESCPMPSGIGGGGGGQAAKSGLDFSLVSGVGYFTQGMQLDQGDTFKVVLKIENYDKTPKSGTVCAKDDKEDVYGGVSEDCSQFYVREADYSQDKFVKSSFTEVYFPSGGEYKYHDVPIAQPSKIFVTLDYVQHSIAQGSASVPEPATEKINVVQTAAPVSISVDKTVSKQENQYKATIGITLSKQADGNLKLLTEDLKEENRVKFALKMSSYTFDCTQGIINMESTKFIKCSALLPVEQISYPLLIYLDYGVRITKSFDFTIKAKEAA